jgi:hypothetical protein
LFFFPSGVVDKTKIKKKKTFQKLTRKKKSYKMGLQISKLFDSLFGKKEMRILMVGLDAAGKVRSFVCLLSKRLT